MTASSGTQDMLTCARDVAKAAFYESDTSTRPQFRLVGRVTYVREPHDSNSRIVAVEDSSGAVTLSCPKDVKSCAALAPGDTAELAGHVVDRSNARLTSCRILFSDPNVKPIKSSITDLLDGRHDFRLTSFTGTLRDIAESETASRWLILVVCSSSERMFVSVPDIPGTHSRLVKFIGQTVCATGVCVPQDASLRLRIGRTFKVARGEDIRIAEGESHVTIPDIANIRCARQSEILSLGRHSTTGRVIAVWQGKHALISLNAKGCVAGLEFADGVAAPHYGDRILAVGLPESDLFRIKLTNVEWSRLPGDEYTAKRARQVSARKIIVRKFGYRLVMSDYHGLAISLRGIVRSLSDDDSRRIHIESDGLLVPVDASSLPSGCLDDVEIGCNIVVSGTCIVNQEKARQSAAFPRMDGFTLVLRTPSDIVVTSRPSWWTPRRLTVVIGGLLAMIIGIIVHNWLQRRKAALMAKFATDLKVEERTRLAVELHDSLAQNLTGVSMEIDTAGKLADEDPKAMRDHLDRAARTLKSCRDELRHCLWDLRNRALEEGNMDEAIRQTLAPHVAGVEVAVRFNVPRERISDNTTHAILRIIRELAINAVRHGHAKKIWIAGSVEADKLLFSVRDDGCGFDPASAPGFADGHYGLVGITERVESFEGEFDVESSPGRGTKTSVKLKMESVK